MASAAKKDGEGPPRAKEPNPLSVTRIWFSPPFQISLIKSNDEIGLPYVMASQINFRINTRSILQTERGVSKKVLNYPNIIYGSTLILLVVTVMKYD